MIWFGISAAGALGAVLHYLVDGVVHDRTSGRFPFGILVVNVAGCLVAGLAMGLLETGVVSPDTKLLLGTGFAGSFTTMSTYTYETVALAEHDLVPQSVVYLVGSVAAGLLAAGIGLVVGSHL
jgi:fluoride exporter